MPSWKVGARRDLPIADGRAWDSADARVRLLDFGDNRRGAFLLYDADYPDIPTLDLPFADVVDGRIVAIADGLRSAARQLEETELEAEDRRAARGVLESYFGRLHEGAQETRPEAERDSQIMLSRAPLSQARASGIKAEDPSTYPEELLAHIPDVEALGEHPLYLTRATASTSLVDTFGTSMLPSSLSNFAEDATSGLSVQNSHRSDELPLGRTWQGAFVGNRNPKRTDMDLYVPRNLNITGLDTNHVIDGIRTGIIRDVSIGFYGGTVRCSICGKEMFTDLFSLFFFGHDEDRQPDPDAPCIHLPGNDYPTWNKKGEKLDERETAVGQIDDAHCAELSFVFDGATPGAVLNGRRSVAVQKAERMAEIGVLSRADAHALQTRYRGLRFPSLSILYGGATLPASRSGGSTTTPQEAAMPPKPGTPTTRSEATDPPAPPTDPPAGDPPVEGDPPAPPVEAEADPPAPVEGEGEPTAEGEGEADPPAEGVADGTRAATSVQTALTSVRSAFIAAGLAPTEFATADTRAIAARVAEVGAELRDLRAASGSATTLRSRLVEQIRAEGIRAYGSGGLPPALVGRTLDSGTAEELIALYEFVEGEANKRFRGGRASKDEPSTPASTTPTGLPNGRAQQNVPLSAFRAR